MHPSRLHQMDCSARNYRKDPIVGVKNICQRIIGMTSVEAHYAWIIVYPGCQDIQKVTPVEELEETLRILELPGLGQVESLTNRVRTSDRGAYFHYEEDDDEWSLTWSKVGEPS